MSALPPQPEPTPQTPDKAEEAEDEEEEECKIDAKCPDSSRAPKSAAFITKEKEIADLLQKIKTVDAEHRKLVQETKKTYPFFDQDGKLTPDQVAALRKKHAEEQLARKKAITTKSTELRQLNLELKRKRQELRRL